MMKTPTAAERAESVRHLQQQMQIMEAHIASIAKARGMLAADGVGLHGLVLKHGVGRHGARLLPGLKRLAPKLCFEHAAKLANNDPDRFVYCEGYALRPSVGLVVNHAWVLDRERDWLVTDNTWQNPIEAEYIGIPLRFDFLMQTLARKQTYGMIDNWQEGYPMLTADPADYLHPEAAAMPCDFTHDPALKAEADAAFAALMEMQQQESGR